MFRSLPVRQGSNRFLRTIALSNLLLFVLFAVSIAQVSTTITLDGTLGTEVTQGGKTFNITGGTRPENGPNLFHSFGQFNVGTGDTASFASDPGVDNIISRVTGGAESMIDGTLQAEANLFLLNPQGIMFGPNATLNVNASFHISTSNVIRFQDGSTFSANLTEESGLTSAPPVAFGFLDNNPAGITIQESQLSVNPGETLSLTGGDITMTEGLLEAPSGRIDLSSVASTGEVRVDISADNSRLGENSPSTLGSVLITNASISSSGPAGGAILLEAGNITLDNGAQIFSEHFEAGQSGDIRVSADTITLNGESGLWTFAYSDSINDAGNIEVDAQSVTIRDGAFIYSGTQGVGRSGDVTVTAKRLTLENTSQIEAASEEGAIGDAGNVKVEAQNVSIMSGSQIGSASFSAGQGGDVTVIAEESVTLDGFGMVFVEGQERVVSSLISASSQQGSTGRAGNVRVDAPNISVTGGAQITSSTLGSEQGGNVIVTAHDSLTLDGFGGGSSSLISASSEPEATGDAGTVWVEAQRITATNGAQISSVTFGAGRGGNVTVIAHDSVTFRGTAPGEEVPEGVLIPGDTTFPSGAFVNSHGSGAPGTVQVIAPMIILADGGRISSLNIVSEQTGGTVIVEASDALSISGTGSSLRTQSLGPGQGGNIEVTTGMLALTNGADISASSVRDPKGSSERSGDAGDVTVTVSDRLDIESSSVTTAAPEANGGDIHIVAENASFRISDSTITAEVNQQSGEGGNIAIEADALILERSQLLTRAGPGTGGDITINGAFVFDGTYVSGQTCSGNAAISCLDASGQVSGSIDEGSPVDTSGITSPLPQSFTQATKLLRQRCAERLQGGRSSSLVLTGRAGVPAELGGTLPSTMLLEQLTGADAVGNRSGQDRIDHLAKRAQTQEAAGLYYQAIATLHTVKELAEEAGDETQLAMSLGHLGNAYIATGPYEKAELYLKQGVELAEALGQAALVARILNNYGNLSKFQQNYAQAQVAYTQSLQFALEANDHALAARVLTNTALAAIQSAQYPEAQAFLNQAWRHIDPLKPTLAKAHTLVSIGLGYSRLHAYLLDNQTDVVQRATSALTEAGAIANGQNDGRTASYAWGYLGYLYLAQGQYQKALQWTRQATLAAQQVNAPESLYRWQWQTGRLFKKLEQMDEAIAAYQRAVATLESFRHELLVTYERTEDLHQTIGPVYFEVVDLMLKRLAVTPDHAQQQKALLAVRDLVELFKVSELQDYFQDECIQAFQAKKRPLEEWTSSGVAIIYPILLPDRLELLISLSSGLERFSVPVDAETLTQEVLMFRRLLEDPTTHDYRRHARQLYDWLIRPFESVLTPAIKTLVFVPDGALRSIPLAALHDGDHFLIEQYAVATTLGLDLIEPRPLPKDATRGRVLAAGLTEGVQNFSPLPYVSDELQFLKAEYDSKTLINAMFRAPVVNQTIEQESYTILHLATHAQFAGDVDHSFLLTYDDKLNMDELREMIGQAQFRDEPIELLTLSACETAVGDDRAVLGLAGVALRAGARSALATLWLIHDQAASQLVLEFYRQLKVLEASRAEALRQAQLKLLKDRHYRHPFFWAAFQILNTWL